MSIEKVKLLQIQCGNVYVQVPLDDLEAVKIAIDFFDTWVKHITAKEAKK